MSHRLAITSMFFSGLLIAVSGSWWVWRTWYSADQIQAAVEADDVDRVALLIKLGAPVDVEIPGEFELELYPDPINGKLLHWAAEKGHLDLAKLLLANGAQVDAKNNYGVTPLHCATDKDHLDLAKLLLASL